MALSVKQLLRRRGALVALVTASAVLLALVAMSVLRILVVVAFGGPPFWDAIGQNALAFALPVALGVFLSLWLILPIDGELELRYVVTRAIGALIPALVLLFVAQSISFGVTVYSQGSQPGVELGPAPFTVEWFGFVLLSGLQSALSNLIGAIPVVLLAAIFQWHWLKHHPAKFDVAGILDV